MFQHRCLRILSVFTLLFAGLGSGQQAFYGSILGTVTDASGSVVPRARVALTDDRTGVSTVLMTDNDGLFRAENLTPSEYTVEVTAPGFQTHKRGNVILRASQQVRVNVGLVVGEVTQVVDVVSASPLLNTENATTSIVGTFTHENRVTIPSQGTSAQVFPDIYYQLMYTHADVQNSAFTIGGSLSGTNAEVQDGMRVEGQRHYVGGNRGLARPGVESVEEVVVTTNSPSAKYPNPSAIESVMKSGGNDFHGSLMYIHGNKSLNARGYYTHQKTPFILHQYFGSIGGPIRKNKTFFFFGQQGFHHPNGEESFSHIPTPQMRSGDLSQFLDPAFMRGTAPVTVIDPLNGQPFPGNRIPEARINPISRRILEQYPSPNRASDAVSGPLYQRNFLLTDLLIRKETFNFDTRVDHYFTPTQHTYVRFSLFDSPNARTQFNLPGFGGNYFIVKTKILTAHHTSAFTPTLTNHIMAGLFNEDDPLGPGNFTSFEDGAIAWNQQLGIPGVPADQDSGFPYLTFSQSALTTPLSYGFSSYKNRIWHVRDDVTWIRGKHSIQFGGEFRRDLEGSKLPGVGQGSASSCQFGCMNFNGRWTNNDYGDFLLGLPFTSAVQVLLPPDFRTRNEFAFYFQDDIRVNSRLNLSFGLRYDYYPVVQSENKFASLFDPVGRRLVVPNQQAVESIRPEVRIPIPVVTAQQAGYPEALLESDKMNMGPRVSVVYRFTDKTIVRSGFGIYHTPLVNIGRQLLTGPYSARSDFPIEQPAAGAPPVLTINDPYSSQGLGSNLINFFGGVIDPKAPAHYNYNLAVEHQIGAQAFTIEYVGKRTIEPWRPLINTIPPSSTPFARSRLPYPELGAVTGLANGAHYDYQALRIHARRRLASGLFFDGAYVWAHAIDDLGGGLSGDSGGSSEDPYNRIRDRGTVGNIQPHRFTISYLYQLPFGKGSRSFLNYLIRGWETAGAYNFQTSAPLTPTGRFLNAAGQQYDAPNTNVLAGRPDYTGQPMEPTAEQAAQGYLFNPNAFTEMVGAGRYGTAGRGIVKVGLEGGMAISQSFYRTFGIPWFTRKEGARLRIGFQMYNAPNHSNKANPTTALNSPVYGRRTNERTGGDTVGFMRTMAFQARVDF